MFELLRSGRRTGYSRVARAIYRSLNGFNRARRRYPQVSMPVILVYSDYDWSRNVTITRCASVNLDIRRGFEPDVSQSYHKFFFT